ncbi:flagellar protein FlaG [Thioalkalivibrio sulfidiphilus]|uniref:flagellar protein FlaG n=1 Tax=Thioalkalivibrio sulfidiphilus TaxID=1033854 RepID=UPI0012DC1888|nr:flagellar protein FlaG [Thioalkalivibrio sulfidiphilus]
MKDMLINPMPQASVPAPAPARKPEAAAQAVAQAVAAGGKTEPPPAAAAGKDLPVPSAPEMPELDLSGVVESLNDYMQSVRRDLRFSVDDFSGRTVITVLDSESQEVIRQIPPESVQALAEYLRDQGGLDSFGVAEKA